MDKKIILTNTELQEVISDIYTRYGYDFRNYSVNSIYRRIISFMNCNNINCLKDLKSNLENKTGLENLVESISVTVTKMFRDPELFKIIRNKVIPELKKLPSVKIWHAGCATGEEAYSLAIILKEEGLDHAEITATDMNKKSINIAKNGIYPSCYVKKSNYNYLRTGGRNDLSDYYLSKYNCSIFNKDLRKSINFKHHNLSSFTKIDNFNFIICRNVFIYFTKELQRSVLNLFKQSLQDSGFLWLGSKENLIFIDNKKSFIELEKKTKIYKKVK